MEHGGKREGAGRKAGTPNLLTHELREKINALALIKFLQDVVAGKVEGATIGERINAAQGLLKKVMPDYRAAKKTVPHTLQIINLIK